MIFWASPLLYINVSMVNLYCLTIFGKILIYLWNIWYYALFDVMGWSLHIFLVHPYKHSSWHDLSPPYKPWCMAAVNEHFYNFAVNIILEWDPWDACNMSCSSATVYDVLSLFLLLSEANPLPTALNVCVVDITTWYNTRFLECTEDCYPGLLPSSWDVSG